jgi:hypothetical protein
MIGGSCSRRRRLREGDQRGRTQATNGRGVGPACCSSTQAAASCASRRFLPDPAPNLSTCSRHGVAGYSAVEAGLAFLPVTLANLPPR